MLHCVSVVFALIRILRVVFMRAVAWETLLTIIGIMSLWNSHILQTMTQVPASIYFKLIGILSMLALRFVSVSVSELIARILCLHPSISSSDDCWTALRSWATLVESSTDTTEFFSQLEYALIVCGTISWLDDTLLTRGVLCSTNHLISRDAVVSCLDLCIYLLLELVLLVIEKLLLHL